MTRAPFQILVFPYRQQTLPTLEYAIFCRADDRCWQGIAGGGEADETPRQAAQRESFEEAGIPATCTFLQLETINSIPVVHFRDSYQWGEAKFIIPEYTFGVNTDGVELTISREHDAYQWMSFAAATKLLTYDGNKIALWELNQKLLGKGPRD
jgi:dihydroneopterin triphosphate diphosphatase